MLRIDFSNKQTLTSSIVYKFNEIDKSGISAKLINVELDERTSGAAFWTAPNGQKQQTEFVISDGIGTFKVPTSQEGLWSLELVVYNDGRPKSATYVFEILKSYSSDSSNEDIETLIEAIVRHDHEYTQNETIRIANEHTRIVEHDVRMNDSDIATNDAIKATSEAIEATMNANTSSERAKQAVTNAIIATNETIEATKETKQSTTHANAQAENAKIQAEFAKVKGEFANQATSDAQTATSQANQATASANVAIANANIATNEAIKATSQAEQATVKTIEATTKADSATASTIKATSEAIEATAKATEATTKANTATTKANEATTKADSATAKASEATVNANKATADANSATQSVQNAIAAGTVDLEPKQARTDFNGVVHANLKTRLDNDYETLASLIPTDIAFDGYESVTTNDTLSGEVSSATLSGNTMVNVVVDSTRGQGFNCDMTYSNGKYTMSNEVITSTAQRIRMLSSLTPEVKKYTLFLTIKTMACERKVYLRGASEFVVVPPNTNRVIALRSSIGTGFSDKHEVYFARTTDNTTPFDNLEISNLVILEGDHTDKPLEFFEGLKSAEVAEINTHGVNLVDNDTIENVSFNLADGTEISDSNFASSRKFYRIKPETNYQGVTESYAYFLAWFFYDENKNFISSLNDSSVATSPKGARFMRLRRNKTHHKTTSVYEVTGSEPSTYIPYQSSKTTLSEPIILRSLPNGVADTYDVDTGILIRRCGEVVLNGSEGGWTMSTTGPTKIMFILQNYPSDITTSNPNASTISKVYCERLLNSNTTEIGIAAIEDGTAPEGISQRVDGSKGLFISIAKSKLPTPDVAGFKAWLAQNPTTVVYQLAESTTEYIENNGQLRSYDSQTTVFANSVVPVKISGNIPVNYASTLANLALQARNLQIENVALIEQAESLSEQLNIAEQTNNFQDELIDVSLMATDELYVMLEPLLAQPMSATNTRNVSDESTKNTQGGNAMVDAYVAMVIRGLKTIDEVPARYREEVRRILAELEK